MGKRGIPCLSKESPPKFPLNDYIERQTMSDNAKHLMYWVNQAASNIADDEEEKAACLYFARLWANAIISGITPHTLLS
jgi:hypothetical protein